MAFNLIVTVWLIASSVLSNDAIPIFKGGQKELNGFIARNLIYPEYSKQNCLQGTIHVSFRLTREGRVFKSTVVKGFGTDLDIEALRIIRLTSGRWKVPPLFDTTQAIVIPINFALKEYSCHERSNEQINKAIDAYKTHQNLTKAILLFYKDQTPGKYSVAYEEQIIKLKQELGYNENYFDRLLKEAKKKLKQGDKEGACEDFNLIRNLGSDKANKFIAENCN